jgi:uncharacterized protein YbjT (DUF2867 family)
MNKEDLSGTTAPQFMIYGANGYTGALTARVAVERGLTPILAGRNAEEIERLAAELDLPYRLFDLEEPGIIDSAIGGVASDLTLRRAILAHIQAHGRCLYPQRRPLPGHHRRDRGF